jgi:hypothetical protein
VQREAPRTSEYVKDLKALAEKQGVGPVLKFEDLLGDFWPDNQSVEDFIAAATEGRYEEDTSDS